MKREEAWLKEACAQLAREETDALEKSLTETEKRRAEEAYRRHRRKALSLIRRGTPGKSPALIGLRAAAVLVLLAGGLYLALRQPPPDTVPQTHVMTGTAAPYYSPVPTLSPIPTAFLEDASTTTPEIFETSTVFPTEMPFSEPTPTIIPTVTPTILPTAEPTPAPTAAPAAEPTLAPTAEPAATPVPESGDENLTPPESWTGSFFPMGLLYDDAALAVTWGEGWQQVSSGGWVFTEYTDGRVLDVPPDAAVSYVQWEDTVALRAETDESVTLIWVQDGRSMRLSAASEDAVEMAKTVQKVDAQ